MISLPSNLQPRPRPEGPDMPDESLMLMASAQMKDEGRFDESKPVRVAGMSDWLPSFLGGKKEPPAAKPQPPIEVSGRPEKVEYPTSEEAEKAIEAGIGYGTTYEDYIYNKTARVMGKDVPKRASATIEGGRLTSISGPGKQFMSTAAANVPIEDLVSAKMHEANPPQPVERLDPQTKADVHNVFARAALAASRDPIAALGFDPKNTLIDVVLGNQRRGGGTPTIGGVTENETRRMYSNLYWPEGSIVHESIHAGLSKLEHGLYKDDTETPRKFKEIIDKYKGVYHSQDMNELITRHLVRTVMGQDETPPGGKEHPEITEARRLFDLSFEGIRDSTKTRKNLAMLKELQDLAAEAIARKRPGGPR